MFSFRKNTLASPKELLLDAVPDERLGLEERKLCKHGHGRLVQWNEAGFELLKDMLKTIKNRVL